MDEELENHQLENLVIKDKEYQCKRKKKILLIVLLVLLAIIIIIIVILLLLRPKGGKIFCIYRTIKENENIHIINVNKDIAFTLYVNDTSYSQNNFHTFKTAGLHNVIFHFKKKLESLEGFFENLDNLVEIDFSKLETENVKSMAKVLQYCQNLTKVNFDNITPNLENISRMFNESYYLLVVHLNFNTSKVTNMDWMFYYNDELTSLDLSNFDLENLVNSEFMFGYCTKLEKIIFKKGTITKNLKQMSNMFWHCESLKNINTEIFRMNKVESLSQVFQECHSLESIDMSLFDTSTVSSIEKVFSDCINLKNINISNMNTSLINSADKAFYNCQSLTSIDLSILDFRKLLSLEYMFANCINLQYLTLPNQMNSLHYLTGMFKNCYNLVSMNLRVLSNFITGNHFNEMFENCTSLKKIKIENEENAIIYNATKMFSDCISLTNIDLENFKVEIEHDITMMFYNCKSLEYLNMYNLNTQNMKNNSTDVFKGVPNNSSIIYNPSITKPYIEEQIKNLHSNSSF